MAKAAAAAKKPLSKIELMTNIAEATELNKKQVARCSTLLPESRASAAKAPA